MHLYQKHFHCSLTVTYVGVFVLIQAALWDNAELLEDLLHGEQVAHINSQDSWGRTPLHAAATTDNSRCLGVLLKAGGNVTFMY